MDEPVKSYMFGYAKKPKPLECSVCGKNQYEVEMLVEGINTHICSECVDLCKDIVEENRGKGRTNG